MLPDRLKQRHQPIVDALLAGQTRLAVANDLGWSYGTVCAVARRLKADGYRVVRAPGRPRNPHARVIVELARNRGLAAAAREHGITRERVRQFVARHETETGDRVPRHRRDPLLAPAAWPQTLLCLTCRYPIKIRSLSALLTHRGYCQMCQAREATGSRLTHEVVEAAIAERLAGGRSWYRLALDLGFSAAGSHVLPRAALIQLRRAGRRDEIDRLWPPAEGGLPRWLRRWDSVSAPPTT